MCSLCKQLVCPPRCPNYVMPTPKHVCSICKEGILNGDEYVENTSGYCIHLDCIDGLSMKDFLYWLGEDIKIYEENEYE